jgi:hypothetical protein
MTDDTAALRCPHRTLEEIVGMSTEQLRTELERDGLCDHERWLIDDELADRLLIDANREGAAMLHAMHAAAQDRALAAMRRTPDERRSELAALREEIAAFGVTATSPDQLDAAIGAWIESHPREFAAWVATQERITGGSVMPQPEKLELINVPAKTIEKSQDKSPAPSPPRPRRTTTRRKGVT